MAVTFPNPFQAQLSEKLSDSLTAPNSGNRLVGERIGALLYVILVDFLSELLSANYPNLLIFG